jgi:hypothetical protein
VLEIRLDDPKAVEGAMDGGTCGAAEGRIEQIEDQQFHF